MKPKIAWYQWLSMMLKEFLTEAAAKSQYEIVNLYECEKTSFMKAVIKLSDRHVIEKNISDIIIDNGLLEGLNKKTIRTLVYMATVERLRPDYSIVAQQLTSEVDDYILEIKSKNGAAFRKSPSELSKDINLLSKLTSVEANRIGYMAGVRETVKEYQIFQNKN